jgi:hypothetical protein
MIGRENISKKRIESNMLQDEEYIRDYFISMLHRIANESAREFIRLCLTLPENSDNPRISPAELLKHPFLASSPTDDEEVKLGKSTSNSSSRFVLIFAIAFVKAYEENLSNRERTVSRDSNEKVSPTAVYL